MYYQYFGLSENPFAITPDPRYLFLSKRHEEALAHLLFGVQEGGGFVQLTGEVGTGKTTLIRALLEKVPDHVDVALIINPKLTAFEFLASICDELKVAYEASQQSLKPLIDALNDYLLQAHGSGRRVVLIVDEAQNFHSDVLEQIRLLTNLETTKQKLLQIILVGQPELRDLLARRDLRQLAQRVTARYHLVPMTAAEVKAYVSHRLTVAGATRPLFTERALCSVHVASGGVPRLVNILCDRALLGAYSAELLQVTPSVVRKAADEIMGVEARRRMPARLGWAVAAAVVTAMAGLGWHFGLRGGMPEPRADVASPAAPLADANAAPASLVVASASASASAGDAAARAAAMLPSGGTGAAAPRSARLDSLEALQSMLAAEPAALDLDGAFKTLFSAWGVDYTTLYGATGCERAISARLHCYAGSGAWPQFVALDHPGLLWSETADGTQKRYLAVMGLVGEDVALAIGGQQFLVPTSVAAQFWNGRYVLLWKPPSLNVELIRPGARSDLVVWLRRSLDRLDGGLDAALRPDLYDRALVERVKAFQRGRSLEPDGIVGEQTLIHLNSLSREAQAPLLSQYRADSTG